MLSNTMWLRFFVGHGFSAAREFSLAQLVDMSGEKEGSVSHCEVRWNNQAAVWK